MSLFRHYSALAALFVLAIAFDCSLYKPSEISALIYEALDGSNWESGGVSIEGWGTEASACEFTGVQCNSNSEIVSLNFSGFSLSGDMPDALVCFTHLKTLVFEDNPALVSLPSDFSLPDLETLHIRHTGLSTVPALTAVPSLIELFLDGNENLLGFPDVTGAPLRALHISAFSLPRIHNSVGALSSLQSLRIENSSIESIPLDSCSNCTSFVVSHTPLLFLPPKLCLAPLVTLTLDDVFITDVAACFEMTTTLRHLTLRSMDVEELPYFTEKLQTLVLDEIRGLSRALFVVILSDLTDLQISNMDSGFFDELPDFLTDNNENLRSLIFNNNGVDSVDDAVWSAESLETLDVSGNCVDDVSNYDLSVTSLNLSFNPISTLPTALVQSEALETLDFSGTNVTEFDFESSSLQTIVFNRTSMCLAGAIDLGKLPNLRELYLGCSYLDHSGLEVPNFGYLTDFSDCEWLHCPNAQEDPVAPGREEISFNEFGPCRAGYECSGIGPGTPCGNGYYSTGGASECTACNSPTQITDKTHTSCSECPAGTFASEDHLDCVTCNAGTALVDDRCVACAPDSTTVGTDRTQCYDCPANSHTEGDDRTVCVADPGYYGTGVYGDKITECPLAHYCPGGYEPASVCGTGSVSGQPGAVACTTCLANTFAAGHVFCMVCPHHSHSAPAATECVADPGYVGHGVTLDDFEECPEGNTCAGGLAAPEPCGSGYYTPVGATQCLRCIRGTYCPRPGCGKCYIVPDGYYASDDAKTIVECPPGSFCRDGFAARCTSGYFSKGPMASECTQCDEGFTSGVGDTQCRSCSSLEGTHYCRNGATVQCPKNSYITSPSRSYCQQCSADYSCDGTTKHEFTIAPFTSLDPSTASGRLTLAIDLGVLIIICAVLLRKRKSPYDSL